MSYDRLKIDYLLPVKEREIDQLGLFNDLPDDWRREWVGMPEFVMGNTEPARKITISFETEQDVADFAEALRIKLTSKTDSVWYPERRGYVAPKNYRWVSDE